MDVRSLIEVVLDRGSWRSWDEPLVERAAPGSQYARELAEARERSGYDESIVTGEGELLGRRVAVIAGEFSFLAGSIGVASAERLVGAITRATDAGLPLLAAPSSGGIRMQEGTVAFLQMIKITAAISRHRASGLPYLVYLRHPTTGGVLASWGSLGHVTAAEPGALIGFLGPRVYEALNQEAFPPGVQVAENLYLHGLVDAVVPPEDLREDAARVLSVLCRGPLPPPAELEDDGEIATDIPAWESIERSRRTDRPGVRALLKLGAQDVMPLHGSGEGESEPGLLLALARFGAAPCVVLGTNRGHARAIEPLGPAGLRVARRGMRLARELHLPLVTLIDTAGATLSKDAEEGGLAAEIAYCLHDLLALPSPTVSLCLGEGTGGAALALIPADRIVFAQHGWLSPLPPEGASAILYRTTDRAAEIAAAQGVRSVDLMAAGVVDRIIPERPDAADEAETFLARVAAVIEQEILTLAGKDDEQRLTSRLERFRRIGLA